MVYGAGGAMGANPYGTQKYRPPPRPNVANTYNPVANQNKPGTNPRVDYLDATMPEWRNAQGYQQTAMANALWGPTTGGGYPQFPSTPQGPGGGGRGGGGGGGGGPAGLDQATLDWLMGAVGRGKPAQLAYNPLDLPDPNSYYQPFDTSAYDTARQGVSEGIAGVQQRANAAYDAAGVELDQFQNPYTQGAWAQNPDIANRMGAMFNANASPTSLMDQTRSEGVQADQAFGNVMALQAGNEQSRAAANKRALAGARRDTELNTGMEGNLLNLGVNTAQGKAKSAYDQMRADASYNNALQEVMQNWQRQNQVGDTNVTNTNTWNQDAIQTLLSIVGNKAPGTTLPDLATLFGGAMPGAAPPASGRVPGTGPGQPRLPWQGAPAPYGVPIGVGGVGSGPIFSAPRQPGPPGSYPSKRG